MGQAGLHARLHAMQFRNGDEDSLPTAVERPAAGGLLKQ